MSRANNVCLHNGKIIFYNNHAIYSTVTANNYKYIVFSDSLNTIGDVDVGERLSVTGQSDFVGPVIFNNPKESYNCNCGSVTFKGGVAIKKNLNIGGSFNVEGSINFTNNCTTVATISIDENGHININNKKICNVIDPTNDLDVANKKYIDENILWHKNYTATKSSQISHQKSPVKTSVTLNDVNDYVGIGTNSPTEKLDVVGNIAVSGTVDGRNISIDGTNIDSHIGATSNVHGIISNIVGTTDAQTLTNKTINSDNNTITNIKNTDIKSNAEIDATKIANGSVNNTEFQYLDGVTSNIQTQINNHGSNTNTHGVAGNIVGTTDAQILSNKNLVDSSTYIVNNANQTKKLKFSLNGADPNKTMTFNFIHTGNRVITMPDTTDTLVTTSLSQILNNKTLTSTSNDITANKLRSFDGSSITINNSAVPSPGQVLTATSATTAKWQSNSSSNTIGFTLVAGQAMATSTTYITVACIPWLDARHNNYTNGVIILHINIVNRDLSIRLQDITNNVTLGELITTNTNTNTNSSSSQSFTVINPTSDARVELQIKKSSSGGTNPRIYGILLEYNII